MRRAALLTVLVFLGQSLVCAHVGFGAAARFATRPAMAAGACARADAPGPGPRTGETPAERCSRHCTGYARTVPAVAPAVHLAASLWLPVERVAFALPARGAETRRAPQRAPPRPPLRLLLRSLRI